MPRRRPGVPGRSRGGGQATEHIYGLAEAEEKSQGEEAVPMPRWRRGASGPTDGAGAAEAGRRHGEWGNGARVGGAGCGRGEGGGAREAGSTPPFRCVGWAPLLELAGRYRAGLLTPCRAVPAHGLG